MDDVDAICMARDVLEQLGEIFSISLCFKLGRAFNMLDLTRFFDLKKGPIKDIILPERHEAQCNPSILNNKNKNDIIKN